LTPPAVLSPPPSAVVVITGDDVYEDLFTAGLKLQEILAGQGFAARTVMGARSTQAQLAGLDLIVLYTALGYFPPSRQAVLARAVTGGAGLLALHAANVFPSRADEDHQTAAELIGSRYISHGPRPHESRFLVRTSQDHQVTRGLAPFEITHEHYQVETAPDAQVVAWRDTPAGPEPVAQVRAHGQGRVCYLQLGHDMRAWDDPAVRQLVTRAAQWASRRAVPTEEP
jgi:uncharacterized protein